MYKGMLRRSVSSHAGTLLLLRTHASGSNIRYFTEQSRLLQSPRHLHSHMSPDMWIGNVASRGPSMVIHPRATAVVPPRIAMRHKSTDTRIGQQDPPKEDRMLIGFTCKVCNHRQHKTMSKNAYKHGVVLIQCDDCKNRHLIADNMGWFRDKNINIQDLMKEKGEEVRHLKDMDLLDGIETDQVKTALEDYDDVLQKRDQNDK